MRLKIEMCEELPGEVHQSFAQYTVIKERIAFETSEEAVSALAIVGGALAYAPRLEEDTTQLVLPSGEGKTAEKTTLAQDEVQGLQNALIEQRLGMPPRSWENLYPYYRQDHFLSDSHTTALRQLIHFTRHPNPSVRTEPEATAEFKLASYETVPDIAIRQGDWLKAANWSAARLLGMARFWLYEDAFSAGSKLLQFEKHSPLYRFLRIPRLPASVISSAVTELPDTGKPCAAITVGQHLN